MYLCSSLFRFCDKNKSNEKGRIPSEEADLNFRDAKKFYRTPILNYLSKHILPCLPPTILMIILFNNNYYNNIIYNIFIISYLIYLLYNNISIYIIINIVISLYTRGWKTTTETELSELCIFPWMLYSPLVLIRIILCYPQI